MPRIRGYGIVEAVDTPDANQPSRSAVMPRVRTGGTVEAVDTPDTNQPEVEGHGRMSGAVAQPTDDDSLDEGPEVEGHGRMSGVMRQPADDGHPDGGGIKPHITAT